MMTEAVFTGKCHDRAIADLGDYVRGLTVNCAPTLAILMASERGSVAKTPGAIKPDPGRLARPVNQVLTRPIRSWTLSVACEPKNLIHLATQGGRGLVHAFLSTTSHETSFPDVRRDRTSRQESKITKCVARPTEQSLVGRGMGTGRKIKTVPTLNRFQF